MIEKIESIQSIKPTFFETFASEQTKLTHRQDLILKDDRLKGIHFEPHYLDLPSPKTTTNLIIDIADSIESMKSLLIKMDLEYQKEISDSTIESQKKFNALLKSKRESTQELADWGYFEKIATGLLSGFTIAIGASMIAASTPFSLVVGTSLALSGGLSLTAIGLEAFGVDTSYTHPISLAGLAVGVIATAVGGYLNPNLFKDSLFGTLASSKVLFSGITNIAKGYTETQQSEIDAALALQQKHQEILRMNHEKLWTELSYMVQKLNVFEQASKLIKQQEDLKYQYVQSMVTQG
ncbi:MAG: sulfite exporter TauE/SafE family protein [Chlamydiae bacterium]|jgi:hypothetical protein|nr:sulfite exporter TauE/SafE family protein [Chlamydiota bacterium]